MCVPPFTLQFSPSQIQELAERYPKKEDYNIEYEVGPDAKKRGNLTKAELIALCGWKSTRPQKSVEKNSEEYVIEITKFALLSPCEEIRINALTLLHGVQYPTASAILHFTHQDKYPIIDFRALESLGHPAPPSYYSFDYWIKYVEACRELAKKNNVTMRILDRALWQFSKDQSINKKKDK